MTTLKRDTKQRWGRWSLEPGEPACLYLELPGDKKDGHTPVPVIYTLELSTCQTATEREQRLRNMAGKVSIADIATLLRAFQDLKRQGVIKP